MKYGDYTEWEEMFIADKLEKLKVSALTLFLEKREASINNNNNNETFIKRSFLGSKGAISKKLKLQQNLKFKNHNKKL